MSVVKSRTTVYGPSAGFTLIELMVTVAVVAILAAVAVPAMQDFFDRRRVMSAAEQIYSHLQQARAESLARSALMYVPFSAGATWQYGISEVADCDLAVTDRTDPTACVIVVDNGDGAFNAGDDNVLMRFTNNDFQGVSLGIAGFPAGSNQIIFSNLRGTATTGSIRLQSAQGRRLQVQVAALGQVRICSPDGQVGGYSTDTCAW
jgi:type IV fimbrial biogenesis protein FimT